MSQKNRSLENFLDPIERERRIRERDEFVEGLFRPVLWDGPAYDLEWLVQDLIPLGYLVLLAGPPKSGKTCLATALAISVANGLPFAGRPVHQGGVLWVSAEESPRERQLLLKGSCLVEPSTPIYTCFQRLPLDDEYALGGIRDWVGRTDARLLVIDPLIACAGRSLTDSWAARKTLQQLKQFAETNRIGVILIHHQKRDLQSYRRARVADSAQLAATASMNIVLSSSPLGAPLGAPASAGMDSLGAPASAGQNPEVATRNAKESPRLVTLDMYGRGEFANQVVYLVSRAPLDFRPTQVEETAPLEESPWLNYTERRVLQVLEAGPRGSAAIIRESGLTDGTVRNAITNLRKKGCLRMIGIGKNQRIYALGKPPAAHDSSLPPSEPPSEAAWEPTREVAAATRAKKRRTPRSRDIVDFSAAPGKDARTETGARPAPHRRTGCLRALAAKTAVS